MTGLRVPRAIDLHNDALMRLRRAERHLLGPWSLAGNRELDAALATFEAVSAWGEA